MRGMTMKKSCKVTKKRAIMVGFNWKFLETDSDNAMNYAQLKSKFHLVIEK